MTKEQLDKANKINQEIKELEFFIDAAKRRWKGKLNLKGIFTALPYGFLDTREYMMDTEIKDKVLVVLQDHLHELKNSLDEI